MKDFVKMVLAVICGLFVMGIVGMFIFFGFIGAAASIGSEKPVLPKSGILYIDMAKFTLSEQAKPVDAMGMVQGNSLPSIGLWSAVKAVNAAAEDPSVKLIYLKSEGTATSIAHMEEFRKSLSNFRKSGKAIISYIQNPTTGSYYMASVADKVYMSSAGGTGSMITGVGSQLIFLKDLLDKLGVNVQLIRHGKYKSAGEMYIRSEASAENLHQNQEMISSVWESLAGDIAESRGITVKELTDMIDNLALNSAEDMIQNKLADELMSKEELRNKLTVLAGAPSYKELKLIPFCDYVAVKGTELPKAKNKIAIIYAEGNIVDGDQKQQVAGDRFASEIAKVRADSTVKAVVFRVSSPGGSVLASDKIKDEIDLLRADKPVIASYGAYAASGGYWISNSCDKIFSDKTTLTGSIGVFSMITDISKTIKNIAHVNIQSVGSSKHSDMFSGTRPLDKDEIAYMQASVEDIYSRFVSNVAEGRGMTPEYVDSIAQGRVWTGADALEIKLVDEIGTLEDAVHFAAMAAGTEDGSLSSWTIAEYPKQPTTLETFMQALGQLPAEQDVFAGTPFESVSQTFKDWKWQTSEKSFARMPFEIIIK